MFFVLANAESYTVPLREGVVRRQADSWRWRPKLGRMGACAGALDCQEWRNGRNDGRVRLGFELCHAARCSRRCVGLCGVALPRGACGACAHGRAGRCGSNSGQLAPRGCEWSCRTQRGRTLQDASRRSAATSWCWGTLCFGATSFFTICRARGRDSGSGASTQTTPPASSSPLSPPTVPADPATSIASTELPVKLRLQADDDLPGRGGRGGARAALRS